MAEHFPRPFGKYVLLKSLARGGMGEIYLAASGQPGGLNKLCVIKKVIAGKADRAKVNRFLDEAKVVLRLSHANLVSTFDAGDVGGELFIAMELVEGKDLREIWNRCVRTRTRIPVDVALVVVRETARALGYVHTYGGLRLVHRDVAPPNILLSYFGEVKLTDFGLARSILKQEHTAPGVVFGRASYLAPEQARGEVADCRTDVYSLGIVLWELLTGQPYLQLAGLDPVTSLSLVRHPKTQPPSSRAPWIVPELDEVVLKALTADRDRRFQSAEELRQSLADVMTRVAPRADAERVAEFLRGLYRGVVEEESAERERLLAETVPRFRGEPLRQGQTPRTDVVPPPTSNDRPTRVAPLPEGAAVAAVPDAPKESLHVSALRARAGSHGPRPPADPSGADAPTKVWRKERGGRVQDAAQTFVGRVIDNRYRIRHRIGEGGMGTVYAAEHVEIGKSVAVKILHRIFSGEEELVERFRREARAASRVGHPHIIEVTDFGSTEEGCAYFVMELLEGMDLADVLLREERLDPARTIRIAVQICQALEAAHASGIIHRDLKPENIFLVARDGQADFVKVLDFGIARNLAGESHRLTNPGMAMGTPEYMAPEQAQGRPADRRTDVYAVGALLHEMIIGVAPFQADSQLEMLEAKRRPLESLRVQWPDIEVSPALEAIITRALSPDPDQRPQTMALLEYELAKMAWGRPQAVINLVGLKEDVVAAGPESTDGEPREGAVSLAEPGGREDRGYEDSGHEDSGSAARAHGRGGVGAGEADLRTPPPPWRSQEEVPPLGPSAPPRSWVGAAIIFEDLNTPPPPRSEGSAGAALSSLDIEKLLEADLSPPPEAPPTATSLATSPPVFRAPAAVPHGFGDGAAPSGVPAGASTAVGRGAVHAGGRQGTSPAALSRQIDVDAARPAPPARRRAGAVMVVFLLVLFGGAAAWAVANGGAGPARAWIRGLRERIAGAPPPAPRPRPVATGDGLAARGVVQPAVVVPRASGRADARLPSLAPAPASGQALSDSSAATRSTSPAVSPVPGPRAVTPEIVQTPPLERARTALTSGVPDDAIAVLRPVAGRGNAAVKSLLADALVASGWNDVKVYRWNSAGRKAREALSLSGAEGASHGGHALLGESLYAQRDFNAALTEFTKALAESPRDARLKRRVIRSRRALRRPATESKDAADSLTSEATSE